ncbi:MAG TPA: LuxR C-terminal-related transcriptional regulator [Phycisphaerales bacterium]|nr:LuxR C-terminal-related transcriptional regulator [Phycisphaerales bacterium]
MSMNAGVLAPEISAVLHEHGGGEALWHALHDDPMTGLQIVSSEGVILYANDSAARLFLGEGAAAAIYVGRSASEYYDPATFAERVEYVAAVLRTGETRVLRSIFHGRQIVSRLSAVNVQRRDGPRERAVLVVSRPVEGDVSWLRRECPAYVDSRTISLGPLSSLSPRELQVLALISQGKSMSDIARELRRSVHTVHDHRKSIGRKLGLDDRVQLATIARQAGLRIEDAGLARAEMAPIAGKH